MGTNPKNVARVDVGEESCLSQTNPMVSAKSRFNDREWLYHDELGDESLGDFYRKILWDWVLPNGDMMSGIQYFNLLLTMKTLFYRLLKGTGDHIWSPRTAQNAQYTFRLFIAFLIETRGTLYRFSEVLGSDLEAFFAYLPTRLGREQSNTLKSRTLAKHYNYLNTLFDFRNLLPDSLTVRPSGDKSAAAAAGHNKRSGAQTQYLSDDKAKRLLEVCIGYVKVGAPILFSAIEKINQLKKSDPYQKLSPTRRLALVTELFPSYVIDSTSSEESPFSQRIESLLDFMEEVTRLRTACFIIICFSTGMRLSEVASIKKGCIRTKNMANHGTFYWIDATLFKGVKNKGLGSGRGQPRSWMCGHLAAQAVEVLEQLSHLLGADKQTPKLLFTLHRFTSIKGTGVGRFSPLTGNVLRKDVVTLCEAFNLGIHVHPHMFRRTFARNIVRADRTSLLALKEHLKHWSLYMTDWYVGLDPELIGDIEAERQILSAELMEKILVGPVSGPGGRRWSAELDKRIKEGRLPRTFRGKAGSEYRKGAIKDLLDAGAMVIPCGDFTFCVFNKDRALCTDGESPVPSKCNSTDCGNSYITLEHVPAHEQKLQRSQSIYENLSGPEKTSPFGELYHQVIVKEERILKDFNPAKHGVGD
jgi:integrase